MSPGGLFAYVLLALNPIGGLLIAIPFGVLELRYPAWFAVLVGVPCCYVQAFVVDLGWDQLERWGWFKRTVEKARSKGRWSQWLIASRGSFWVTYGSTPFLGPWMVMALMKLAGVPHRRIAPAMLLSILTTSSVLAALCVWVPAWFRKA